MKIIRPGDPNVKQWWVNQKLTCCLCKAEYQIEEGDDQHPHVIVHSDSKLSFLCGHCGRELTLTRSPSGITQTI